MSPDRPHAAKPRVTFKRPGAAPQLSADSRPGHPRNAAANRPSVRFTDWALI